MRTRRWPAGTGQWSRIRTVIVAADEEYRSSLELDGDTAVVATPLELISRLEDSHSLIATVVIVDPVAHRELATFLIETYPWVDVVYSPVEHPTITDGRRLADPMVSQPALDPSGE